MFGAIINTVRFVNKLRAGNAEAYERLWTEGVKNVIPFLRWARFGEPEDLWQDLWLILRKNKCAGYDPAGGNFSSWLLTVAKNFARERERERRSWSESIEGIAETPTESITNYEKNGGNQDRVELLNLVLDSLDDSEHELLWLKFDLRLKSREIARRLGCTCAAIRQRLSRLLRRLKEQILEIEKNELRRSHKHSSRGDSS
jgi:RNA polymerase sigma factor (sigma-70 family)